GPVAPAGPGGPCGPVAPIGPVSPVAPVAPATPCGPTGPDSATTTRARDSPVTPVIGFVAVQTMLCTPTINIPPDVNGLPSAVHIGVPDVAATVKLTGAPFGSNVTTTGLDTVSVTTA